MDETLPPFGLVHMTVMTGSCVLGKSSMLRAMIQRWHEHVKEVAPRSVDHVLPYVMYEMIGCSEEDLFLMTDDCVQEHTHLQRSDGCKMYVQMCREMRDVVHEFFRTSTALTQKFARSTSMQESSGSRFEASYKQAVDGWIEKLLDGAARTMQAFVGSSDVADEVVGRYAPIILDRWPQLDSEAFRMAAIAVQNPELYKYFKEAGEELNGRAATVRECVGQLLRFVTQRRCLLTVDVIHCRPPPANVGSAPDPSHVTFKEAQQAQPELGAAWRHAYVKRAPTRWDMFKAREARTGLIEPPSAFCDTKAKFERYVDALDVELEAVYDEFLQQLSASAQQMFKEAHDAYFTGTRGVQRRPWALDHLMRLRDMWAFARRGRFDLMLDGDECSVAKEFTRFYVNNQQRYVRRWVPYLLEWRGVRVTWPKQSIIPFMVLPEEVRTTAAVAAPPAPPAAATTERSGVQSATAIGKVEEMCEGTGDQEAPDQAATEPAEKRRRVGSPLSAAEVFEYCGGPCSQAIGEDDDTVDAANVVERWAFRLTAPPTGPGAGPESAMNGAM